MTSLDGLVKALSDCLEADATDEALIALIARPFEIASLETGQQPQLALGVAATLMAGALLRLGRHGEVAPLFIRLNDELSPPGRKGEGYWRLLNPFHFLHAPLIDAALALQDQTLAVSLLNGSVKELTRAKPVSDPLVSQLLAHPKAASYGPFHIDVAWLLDRHEHALGLGELDHRLVDVQKFHAGYVQSEWAVQRARYMTLETIGQMSDDPLISLPAVAR